MLQVQIPGVALLSQLRARDEIQTTSVNIQLFRWTTVWIPSPCT
uniref:Uncharacterized protein n=1 Tax=Anguilla anguilla TaxID=7936 RepID=A0A0E9QCX8_ANGAN